MNPLISVIIPLYNHEKFIVDAARSVLDQTYENLELIIIDDGSSDNSLEMASSLKDPRIRLFSQENKGAHATINRGINSARGEYIAILNSDDLYTPDRLQACIDTISADGRIDALFTRVQAIHEEGEHKFFFRNAPRRKVPLARSHPDQFLSVDLLEINIVTTTSNLFCKKTVFQDCGLFNNYRYCHDLDFFLRLFQTCQVHRIDKRLLKYRVHARNTLKENKALTHFESALVRADFLRKHLPASLFPGMPPSEGMSHFLTIIKNYHTDRIILTLLQYEDGEESWNALKTSLLTDPSHPFRIEALKQIQETLKQEENRRLKEKRLQRLLTTLDTLKQQNRLYRDSLSHRIGRGCTWPARKLLAPFKR